MFVLCHVMSCQGWKVLFVSGFTVGGIVAGIIYPGMSLYAIGVEISEARFNPPTFSEIASEQSKTRFENRPRGCGVFC